MGVNGNEDAEGTRRKAIVLFILFAVCFGVALIAIGILLFRGSYVEMMLATIGSTLIAVGVVDVVSESFIRPGTIDVMRRAFPLFANPAKVPKDTLKQQMINIASHVSPKKELCDEFAKFFKEVLVDQLTDYCRENFDVSVRLEKVNTGPAQGLVKVTSEWKYVVHNTSNKQTAYPIKFYCDTDSFVSKVLTPKDHIEVQKLFITHGSGNPDDIGQKNGIYKQLPKQHNSRVVLDLTKPILVEMLPNEPMYVYIKYWYLAGSHDRHSQRMSMLTHNISLIVDFDKKDFVVTIDEFCSPERATVDKYHRYDWNGWLLPNHGIIVEWKPA